MSIDQYDKALEQALTGMDGPIDLHPIVSAFLMSTGGTITREEIPDLILDSDRNAPGRRKFHIRLSEWDAEKEAAWAGGTAERTAERRALIMNHLGLTDDAAARIREAFPVFVDRTTVIAAPDWTPWYDEERRRDHHFYWDGYRSLLERRLPPESVADIDAATTDIVGRLADPSGSRAYQSKGLVVGHVQSGKTANFTGVIAKAIDAGYRLIIVLTGTVEGPAGRDEGPSLRARARAPMPVLLSALTALRRPGPARGARIESDGAFPQPATGLRPDVQRRLHGAEPLQRAVAP